MAQSLDLHLGFSSLIPVAHADLSTDDVAASGFLPGSITMGNDKMGGFKVFRYGRTQQSGGQSKGELATKVSHGGGTTTGLTGTVTNVTGELNDTEHLSDTSNFTVGNEVGKVCIITTNNDSAGAAPEGESALIIANTVTTLTFDPDYALSTAVAVSDTYLNWSVFTHDDAADGDFAINVWGLLMADRSAAYYGWSQIYGFNPGAIYTTAAVTKADPVVADAAALLDFSSDNEDLWVGYAPDAVSVNLASPFRAPVVMDLWHMAQPVS